MCGANLILSEISVSLCISALSVFLCISVRQAPVIPRHIRHGQANSPVLTLSTIRREIAANLASKDDFVLVNCARRALGQKGGGHISPLGAYDESSESFLIMDVNPNRAPWVWVRSDELIAAMRTFDTVENLGYLLVSDVE